MKINHELDLSENLFEDDERKLLFKHLINLSHQDSLKVDIKDINGREVLILSDVYYLNYLSMPELNKLKREREIKHGKKVEEVDSTGNVLYLSDYKKKKVSNGYK